MNEQLKELNRKLNLINDILQMNEIKCGDKLYSNDYLTESLVESFGISGMLSEQKIRNLVSEIKSHFAGKDVSVKRKVVKDNLLEINVVEIQTGNIFHLDTNKFLQTINTLKFKTKYPKRF